MKKLLGIVVLGLLLGGNAYADDISIFNKWLLDNDNYELGKKVESEKCKSFDKGDINWYSNNCDQPSYKNNKKIKLYKVNGLFLRKQILTLKLYYIIFININIVIF